MLGANVPELESAFPRRDENFVQVRVRMKNGRDVEILFKINVLLKFMVAVVPNFERVILTSGDEMVSEYKKLCDVTLMTIEDTNDLGSMPNVNCWSSSSEGELVVCGNSANGRFVMSS